MSSPINNFSSNKYKFILTSTRFKDNKFELTVSDINIPSITLGIIEQPTPIRIFQKPGDSINFGNLSAEFLIAEDFSDYKTIYDWLFDLRNFNETNFNNEITSDAELFLLSNKSNPVATVKFNNVFPVSLSDVQLTLKTTTNTPTFCTVDFAYQDLSFENYS